MHLSGKCLRSEVVHSGRECFNACFWKPLIMLEKSAPENRLCTRVFYFDNFC